MNKKDDRQKISLIEIINMFPTDEAAEKWFISNRWDDGVVCPCCGSHNVNPRKTERRSWRCRDCRKDFSTKTGTLMQGSNLGFRIWAIAIYLLTTNLKGVASTKLASDLKITQKTAWHLAMRIRETYNDNKDKLSGIVEVDECYIGGKEANRHMKDRVKGVKEKSVVLGAVSRNEKKIKGFKVKDAKANTLFEKIIDNIEEGSTVITDEHKSYYHLYCAYNHQSVNHSKGEYLKDEDTHTNSIESFWSLLKRGYYGTHHFMSAKHLTKYINEFAGRHNVRKLDTIEQLASVAKSMIGKQLRYKDLVNG